MFDNAVVITPEGIDVFLCIHVFSVFSHFHLRHDRDPGSRKWNKPINPESRGGRKNIPVKSGYKQGNGICQLFLGS